MQLTVRGNPQLTDLSALSNLASLGALSPPDSPFGVLGMWSNATLPACWVTVLEEQTDTTCGMPSLDGWIACDQNTGTGTCEN